MRIFVVIALVASLSACSSPVATGLELTLTAPARISLAHSPHAFVDRTYPEWWYFISDEGLGDNPSDLSPTRLTFTMLGDHAQIDSYTHGDVLFRAPGWPECDAFTGTLALSGTRASWRVDINARCETFGYALEGSLQGAF